jgi:hypothetical protein
VDIMNKETAGMRCAGVLIVLAWLGSSAAARADVTIEQSTTLDVASMIRMHGTSTESFAADKKRSDSETHCEGMMSIVCGNQHGGEIVRLDRDVTWRLEPDKKRYREEVFATPEQLKMMRTRMEAMQEKMRSCPVPQSQAAPIDKSKCEMSPPKIDVRKTDETKTIAGHDTQRTIVSLTESCTDRQTGDVCDTVVAFDLWLTQDSLPGSADQKAFQHAYAQKLGLDDPQGVMRGEVTKFLAAYQSQIKQLSEKSSDLKGQPLRTALRVLMGGEHCASAAKMKDQSPAGGSSSLADASQAGTAAGVNSAQAAANAAAQTAASRTAGSGVAGSIAQSAVGASVGKLMSGMFNKKKTPDSNAAPVAPPAVAKSADPFASLAQMAQFTIETVSIRTDTIAADRFDIPPGWTKETPKANTAADKEFTCPKTGS